MIEALDITAVALWMILTMICYFMSYIAEAMLLHCFYDDGIKMTMKKAVILLIMLACMEVAVLPIQFITKQFVTPEKYEEIRQWAPEFFNTLFSWMSLLFIFLSMSVQKGIGIKRTVQRFIVAVFFYYLIAYNITLVSSISFFCVTESTIMTKRYNDISDKEAIISNTIYFVCALLVVIYLYFNYYKKQFAVRPRKIDIVFVILYAVFLVVLNGIFAALEMDNNELDVTISIKEPSIRVLLGLALLILIIAVPIVMIRGRVNAYYKEVNNYQQTFLETELNASRQYKAAQEDTRAFRHDVQNNLSVVAMLMEQGKVEEAQQYLNDMRTEVNALSPKVVTGDEMIDSIVSSKLPKMEEIGIKFDLDGVIDGGLDWKPMDICTVFANLIDNAIEASSKTEEPFIDLAFKKTDHHRLVRASNSCIENVDTDKLMSGEAHVTTKENKSLHGYGVGNIRKTVEKYGGMMRLSCEDKVFTMELILPK